MIRRGLHVLWGQYCRRANGVGGLVALQLDVNVPRSALLWMSAVHKGCRDACLSAAIAGIATHTECRAAADSELTVGSRL